MSHTIGKFSTRATTLPQTSFQLEVCKLNYGPPKPRKSQIWKFRNSHLRVLRQNAIWVLVPWLGIEYTIRGNMVTSPKSGPWWVLWVWIYPLFIREPKVLKLCTNQLVLWFVQVYVNNWCLSFFPVPILELQHAPLPPKCCKTKKVLMKTTKE
jgi:hypothetical protein